MVNIFLVLHDLFPESLFNLCEVALALVEFAKMYQNCKLSHVYDL